MTKPFSTASILRLATLGAVVALATACGDDQPEPREDTGNSPQMIERQAPRTTSRAEESPQEAAPQPESVAFKPVPDFEGKLAEDGMGLETIIDASSRSAYMESMRWIAEDSSQAQFKRLKQSLRYISTYDPAVLGNDERFLELANGKTGMELIDRATSLVKRHR